MCKKKKGPWEANSKVIYTIPILIDIELTEENIWKELFMFVEVFNLCRASYHTHERGDNVPDKAIICGEYENGRFENLHFHELGKIFNSTYRPGMVENRISCGVGPIIQLFCLTGF
jgi:hypothetical protein